MTSPAVVVLSAIDPVLRGVAAGDLLCDLPGALVVQHDLLPAGLRRVVYGSDGVREDVLVPLEHACLSCALREDVLPTVRRTLAGGGAAPAVVLALPATAEPLPVVQALVRARVRVGPLVTVLDGASVVDDLLGDDLLSERGIGLTVDDARSVGEALAHQLELADVVLLPGPAPAQATAVLEHLAPEGARHVALHSGGLAGATLVEDARTRRARREELLRRGDPRCLGSRSTDDRAGVWTLDLRSWRPFHPARLLEEIEALGAGPMRGRGCFWLPTRPDVVVAWDGAGGQLSIGGVGSWGSPAYPGHVAERETRLLVTGVDHDPAVLRRAFDSALMTDAELATGLDRWAGRPDGFDAWLGPLEEVA
ncbi:CobW family GTP-binding protein [Motilibacter deserti]|uniref:Cobalamin biosynthesis protein CobW n=1 Tax=Motilibacter deserti TaxID=2714956 RepID=A0ABX0GYN3_9ACTN|nr:GTP-binding protein [Motilibacter deserti]NHC14791.1 cobalamin biosynthesis protein CobW [Motilibacter deserti]